MSEPNSYARDRFNIRGLFENSPMAQGAKAKLLKHVIKGDPLRVVWQPDLEDMCSTTSLTERQQKELMFDLSS